MKMIQAIENDSFSTVQCFAIYVQFHLERRMKKV